MNINSLILASSSEHRRKLLKSSGLQFLMQPPQFDEMTISSDSPSQLAILRAQGKAMQVAQTNSQSLVIGSDQVADFHGDPMDIVTDATAAKHVLTKLTGHTHMLHSAFCLVYSGHEDPAKIVYQKIVTTTMSMRSMSVEEIDAYVETGEWQGCCGCYRYEGLGVHLFDLISGGETSAIIGLPLGELMTGLRFCGVNGILNPLGPWTFASVEC